MYFILNHSKQHFKKVRNATMSRNNHMELDKITLARWVDQALEQSITKKITFGFMTINIWPFNPKAMHNKIQPSQIYITKPINNQGNENNTIDDEVDHNQDWGEKCATVKILHIGEVVSQSTTRDLLNMSKHD
jgi:hypothetical protein